MGRVPWFLLLGLMALPASAAQTGAQHPPNIVLITVDTLRADHLSSYGYPLRTSPYIDGLAAAGIRFERAYTVIPLTGPSHLSIMTGRYPQEIGVRRNGVAPPAEMMIASLPEVLGKHGYRRGAFISAWPLTAHLTHLNDWFDDYDEDLNRTYQLFNSSRYAEDVTPRALEWLRKNAKSDKPFFLWVHYFDPHSPYDFRDYFQPKPRADVAAPHAKKMDTEMKERIRAYDSEVYYTDHYIGQLLQEMDKLGVTDSTLTVLTADHGESLGEHGYVGHGRHLYENIVHIPLIMRFPGKTMAGRTIKTPVSSIDIAPTILDIALGDWAKGKAESFFTGKSLAKAVLGVSEPEARRVYYVTFAGKKGFLPNWLSSAWVHDQELPLAFGYVDGINKVVWRPGDKKMRLADLGKDPFEAHAQWLGSGKSRYKATTSAMSRWFNLTDGRTAEEKLSAHDREVLKSLGYAQ
jgi:arylsulfatase A-like enzyme